jgi:hypothetical protein
MAEFSQRSAAIEERKTVLIGEFVSAYGRQPTSVEVLNLRRRATLETRPAKEHHSLADMTGGRRRRAEGYIGDDQVSWVAELADRNDLPLLHAGDLADGILADAAAVAVQRVAERRSTFSRANVLAEVHRQLHGVRFASPEGRIVVAERTADMALAQSLLISAPELHHTPEQLLRADGTSRFRAKGHEVYTTATLLEVEARLLEAGRQVGGSVASMGTVAAVTGANLPGRDVPLSLDQALAVEQIATSGRRLDVLVGPAGTGKSTTMAGLRAVWEAEHGAGSVLGLAPSAAAAEVLADELGMDTENTAKWLHEHRREAERLHRLAESRAGLAYPHISPGHRSAAWIKVTRFEDEVARWRLRADQLVIVDEASLAGTFALDELVRAAGTAGAKVVLVGDDRQISAVDAGGMFAALVRDHEGLAPELGEVRRFTHNWEREASVELRQGSPDAIDTYTTHGRISEGDRDQMLDALYLGWKEDTDSGRTSLMIAGDLGSVSELNGRARADRIAAGDVEERGLDVAGGETARGGRQGGHPSERPVSLDRPRLVRNGDQWTVTSTNDDGSMTLQRVKGTGNVVLPADYVAQYVELDYASTAHRAQGRSIDTAHAMVSPTTTREVLYVSATRGREHNRLYVDTHYDPDPQTSHDGTPERVTARQVLAAVLRNEGADVAAHEVICRHQHEAEGMERLSAEYLTLATLAQTERWDALLAGSGLTEAQLEAIRVSEAHGPLRASFRGAEARGLDVEATFPRLVAGRTLADAVDVAAVLHSRVDRWTQAAGARRRRTAGNLIAGLIPRVQGVRDPEMAQALAERDHAMEERARVVAFQGIESGQAWAKGLGTVPDDPARRARWVREVSTVAAYRDRWHITGEQTIGSPSDAMSSEQTSQRCLAEGAATRALAIGHDVHGEQASTARGPADGGGEGSRALSGRPYAAPRRLCSSRRTPRSSRPGATPW